MVSYLKAIFLTHGLNLADDFIYKAFLYQCFAQSGFKSNRYIAITLGCKALSLGHSYIYILRQKFKSLSSSFNYQLAILFQLFLCSTAIERSNCLLNGTHVLANLLAKNLKLWLVGIGKILLHVILESYSLDIQLAFNNFLEELIKSAVCLYVHITDWLTVLDIGSISCGTA